MSTRRGRGVGDAGGRSTAPVLIALLVVLVVVGGLAWGGFSVLGSLFGLAPDYEGNGRGHVIVEVRSGQTLEDVGETLENKGVVKSVEAFQDEAEAEPEATSLQPGHYALRSRMAAAEALALLLDPASRVEAQVTLPEGSRLTEILDIIVANSKMRRSDLVAGLGDATAIGLPPYADGHPEGYVFPATYAVDPDTTARTLLQDMVSRFHQAASNVDLRRRARDLGVTPGQAVVVASLVEGEARHAKDYGKVARVVYNRLDQGMRLQFDSTVNYALDADKTTVTLQDLEVASPYNTYRHAGLPPRPIGSPGEAALKAALDPPKGNWLYFVTVDRSGTTKFTDSYQQFLRFKHQSKSGG